MRWRHSKPNPVCKSIKSTRSESKVQAIETIKEWDKGKWQKMWKTGTRIRPTLINKRYKKRKYRKKKTRRNMDKKMSKQWLKNWEKEQKLINREP
jgi:hypothetical protein